MRKLLTKHNVITRPMIIVFLVIISLVMTTGTFAYWAIEIESADTSTQSFLQVGTQLEGTTWYEIMNEEDPCEYITEFLIPHDRLIDSEDINEFDVIYSICEINGEDSGAELDIEVSYDIVIYKNGELANDNFYNKLMEYINVEINSNNPVVTNNGSYEYLYTITFDNEIPHNILNIIDKTEFYIVFDYNVD